MGMLDTLKQFAGGALRVAGTPEFGDALSYIQARRMGIPAHEILPQMNAARSARARDDVMKRQVAVQEEEQRAEQEALRQAAEARQWQQQQAGMLSGLPREEMMRLANDPGYRAQWYAPGTDPKMTEAVFESMQGPKWTSIGTVVGPDNVKRALQEDQFGNQREVEIGAQRPPASTTVNVGDGTLDKYQAKLQAEWEDEMAKSSTAAVQRVENIARLRPLIDQVETGRISPAITTIGGLMQSVGLDPAMIGIDPNLPATAESIKSITNKMALANRQNMPGAMSDADRIFLMETVPSIRNTPEGNRVIMQIEESIARRDIEKYSEWVEYAGKKVQAGLKPNRHEFEMYWQQKARSIPLFNQITDPKLIAALPTGTVYSDAQGRPQVKMVVDRRQKVEPESKAPWKEFQIAPREKD